MADTTDDTTNPAYVTGAVLAQLEDLNPTVARYVLTEILRTMPALDDHQAVVYHYREASHALRQLHAVASEEAGLTGPLRDALFGINSTLDAVMALAGVEA
jgi:hypothetical protein